MSETTKEINKITGMIIRISLKLIVFAIAILILYEGVTAGYEFGYDIFYASSVDPEPGTAKQVTMKDGISSKEAADILEKEGLIRNEYSFIVQAFFFEYEIHPGTYELNTSMTSREILEILDEEPEEAAS